MYNLIDIAFWWIGAIISCGATLSAFIALIWLFFIDIPYRYTKLGKWMRDAMKDAYKYRRIIQNGDAIQG